PAAAPAAAPAPAATPATTTTAPATAGATPPAAAGTTPPAAAGATPPPASGGVCDFIPCCIGPACSNAEVVRLYTLPDLNLRTFLTNQKFDFAGCRTAYLADLEADQRRIVEAKIKEIEDRRRAEEEAAAAAAAAANPGRHATEPPPPPPPPPAPVPFAPNREFDAGRYPACGKFNTAAQLAMIDEINGKMFAPVGYQVAAIAFRTISDLTAAKLEFVWLLDLETGRGVAKNNEFKAGTADAFYYQKGIGEIFEGLAGAPGQKIMQAVRSGTVYRDIWHTREELGDSLTGFVHVAMVPILGPDGNAVGLLAAAVRMENLARVARSAHAKILLVRKVARQGAETIEVIGDGNDDLKTESLPDGFRKGLLASRDADLRAVAGLEPDDADTKGTSAPFDFEDSGTMYLGQVFGVTNSAGMIARGDASFAVGPVAVAALVDKTQAMEVLSTIWQIWIFTGIAFLIAVIAALILARSFLHPITLIEDGLLRIMNGDWTHRFEVKSAELGGLSYRINQLMAALLGDEEEGEMEGVAGEAAADPRDAYYQGLYAKFQAAQQQIRQDPNSVSFADFKARLVENERKILEKNPGKQIEFEILVQNNQITFKPIVK
ncbi:MAG: hypothetical protein HY905_05420, partial [Deltaproteobacteria bacterium]|nr:hypothetical protein [Deltaproteobacteria bacterium]